MSKIASSLKSSLAKQSRKCNAPLIQVFLLHFWPDQSYTSIQIIRIHKVGHSDQKPKLVLHVHLFQVMS